MTRLARRGGRPRRRAALRDLAVSFRALRQRPTPGTASAPKLLVGAAGRRRGTLPPWQGCQRFESVARRGPDNVELKPAKRPGQQRARIRKGHSPNVVGPMLGPSANSVSWCGELRPRHPHHLNRRHQYGTGSGSVPAAHCIQASNVAPISEAHRYLAISSRTPAETRYARARAAAPGIRSCGSPVRDVRRSAAAGRA